MEEEPKSPQPSFRARLLSNESLCISESEYSSLLLNLSPRHRNSDQVAVSISFHSKHKGKHIIYKISGQDLSGPFESLRRYSDFLTLRTFLSSQWPGCYIPKLPPKKRIVSLTQGTLTEEFLDIRMRLLANFLKKVSNIVHLYSSQIFQMFVRNSSKFEDLCKSVKPLTNLDLYLNFKENFPIEGSFEYSEETNIYVLQTVHYLKNSLLMIKSLKVIVKQNIENFHKMKFHLCKLMSGIKELAPIFKNHAEIEFNAKKKRYQMYLILLDWARSEILDIEAFIEGIYKMIEISENFKIKEDHSLKNLLEENLENNQLKAQIVKMVQQRLVLFEIPRFREQKASKWETVLRTFLSNSRLEMQNVEDIITEIDKNFNS